MSKILIFGESDIGTGIKSLYPSTIIVSKSDCDVRDEIAISRFMEIHKPSVVVNCAGVSNVQAIKNSESNLWQEEIDVNLIGSYLIAKQTIASDPKIVLIFFASVAGLFGKPNHSGYCASKAGVISLVQSLAMEGYTAYSISPGRVNTKMREKDFPGEDIRTRLSIKEVAKIVANCINGVYQPGDNIIIRKRGFRRLTRIDRGSPWRKYLNVKPIFN